MSGINKMDLLAEEEQLDNSKAVNLVHAHTDIEAVVGDNTGAFKLSLADEAELYREMPRIMALPFWSPGYQAIRMFLTILLEGGTVSPSMHAYYSAFARKERESILVDEGLHTEAFKAFRHADNSSVSLLFDELNKSQIDHYARYCSVLLANKKLIFRAQNDVVMFSTLFKSLLTPPEGADYGPYLPYAAYLYRYGPKDKLDNAVPEYVDRLYEQLKKFSEDFKVAFDKVRAFVERSSSAYKWYCDDVRDTIAATYEYGADRSKLNAIVPTEVMYRLPQWVAYALKDYIKENPCYNEVPLLQRDILDVLQYTFSDNRPVVDPYNVLFFTINRPRLNSLFSKLHTDQSAVESNVYVTWMINRCEHMLINKNQVGYENLEDYMESLVLRGFDLRGAYNA